jgi:hypothetical protein
VLRRGECHRRRCVRGPASLPTFPSPS